MGVSVKNSYNEINVIIRSEGKKQIFNLNKDNRVEKIAFDILTQCFIPTNEYSLKLDFAYSEKSDPYSKDLKILEISKYKLNKQGFFEEVPSEDPESIIQPKSIIKIGFIEGFNADLRLEMDGIKLREGYYELMATVDDKIITRYPFIVKKD